MEHRICGCHSHRPSLCALGYKTQGINGKWGKNLHSRTLHICYTYNYVPLGHAVRKGKRKNRILQPAGKFLLPSYFFPPVESSAGLFHPDVIKHQTLL